RGAAAKRHDGPRRAPDAGSGLIDAAAAPVRFDPSAAPSRTWTTARNNTAQTSLDCETSLPHSSTTTPRTPTTGRSQQALAATHRPAPPAGPPGRAQPTP